MEVTSTVGIYASLSVVCILLSLFFNVLPALGLQHFFSISSFGTIRYFYIEGSVNQPDTGFTSKWTDEMIRNDLEYMKESGMNTVVIYRVANTGREVAFYPNCSLYPKDPNIVSEDFIEVVMAKCDQLGFKVYLGLPNEMTYWNGTDRATKVKNACLKIAPELVARYGRHPSWAGWFIPHEFQARGSWYEYWVPWFRDIIKACKNASNKPAMMFPFVRPDKSWTPEMEANFWRRAIPDMGVDIILYQDGGGADSANETTYVELCEPYFAAVKSVCQERGADFWINLDICDSNWHTCTIERLKRQIKISREYTDRIMIFTFLHFMDPQAGDEQRKLYSDYLNYTAP